ncbi:MAG: acetoacetate decarboxylase family protein [Hyphomicrobium sp.]
MGCKLIPGVGGKPGICQLVTYSVTEIIVKGSWIGPGRLHLVSHVNAPVAARAAHHRRPNAALRLRVAQLSSGRLSGGFQGAGSSAAPPTCGRAVRLAAARRRRWRR